MSDMTDKFNLLDKTPQQLGQELIVELRKTNSECNMERCLTLIAAGADTHERDENDGTALMYAAMQFDGAQLIPVLIEAGAERDATDNALNTALIWSVRKRNLNTTNALIEAGVSLETKGHLGMTALHHAAWMGQGSHVKALLEAGADIDATSDDKKNASDHAGTNGHQHVIRLLAHTRLEKMALKEREEENARQKEIDTFYQGTATALSVTKHRLSLRKR